MNDAENVKLINLTIRGKQVLVALFHSPQREGEYEEKRPEGNNVYGIAKQVYGSSVLKPHLNLSLKPSVRSSLNRLLKHLWKKGLILKCRPRYRYGWYKSPGYWEDSLAYWEKRFEGLEGYEYGNVRPEFISVPPFTRLPNRTHVWWILTAKGCDLAEEITGIKTRRERCQGCNCWSENHQTCQLERIGEDWKKRDECDEENVWEWHDEYGWEYKGA